MTCLEVSFTRHALERMFSRSITPHQVRDIVENGEAVVEYTDDTPFPSTLLLGYSDTRAIHVVVGRSSATATCYIITVYEPDPVIWENDFKKRRQK